MICRLSWKREGEGEGGGQCDGEDTEHAIGDVIATIRSEKGNDKSEDQKAMMSTIVILTSNDNDSTNYTTNSNA